MAKLKQLFIASSVLVAGLALSGCGSAGAVADARLACKEVKTALATQKKSEVPGISSSQVDALQSLAISQLLKGSHHAARATASDGSWIVLQTAINESERVPLKYTAATLTRICKIADSSTPYL
jgi:glucose/arabinose dehydrogenase